jgi:hypothetical protein
VVSLVEENLGPHSAYLEVGLHIAAIRQTLLLRQRQEHGSGAAGASHLETFSKSGSELWLKMAGAH